MSVLTSRGRQRSYVQTDKHACAHGGTGRQSSPAEREARAYLGGALSDRFDQYSIREFLAQATNSEHEKSPGYFLMKKLQCTRIEPLHLDKDSLEQFSHGSALANGRELGGGSQRAGKRVSVLQSVG